MERVHIPEMRSPKDPFHSAIIKVTAYCPDSLASWVRFAKLDQLRDHHLTLSHPCHRAEASWEVRRRGGVCVVHLWCVCV